MTPKERVTKLIHAEIRRMEKRHEKMVQKQKAIINAPIDICEVQRKGVKLVNGLSDQLNATSNLVELEKIHAQHRQKMEKLSAEEKQLRKQMWQDVVSLAKQIGELDFEIQEMKSFTALFEMRRY